MAEPSAAQSQGETDACGCASGGRHACGLPGVASGPTLDRLSKPSAARTLRALVGVWHLLRLLLWIIPYCLLVFGGAGAEALGRRLWRASDWVYDRAGIDSARRWKDRLNAR